MCFVGYTQIHIPYDGDYGFFNIIIIIKPLICPKAELLKGVNIVMKAVPSKTTMPILECILIDASTNNIKFTSNDMELGIETIIEGNIE